MFDLFSGVFSSIFSLIGALFVAALWIVPMFVIFKKLGHNPLLALAWLFPPVGLIVTYYVAFVGRDDDDDF